jgi:DNA repair exonuclease SbcCD nuclease subunit
MSKIFLIGDTHIGLGYPNSLDKWFKVHQEYFSKFLIPLLKKEVSHGDIIVHLGDLFDNRNIVPINILNYGMDIVEEISRIAPLHIIVGNHDLWSKSASEINSVRPFRYIPNVKIYSSTEILEYNNLKILMMPFFEKRIDQIKEIEKNKDCDYLFCHSDLNGCRTQLNPTRPFNRHILDINDFTGYKKIYSGHIHIVQQIQNFTFVGSPYHLDRNDVENTKGIFVYDTKKQQDIFIPNDFSPEFKKIKIYQQQDFIKLQEELKTNNFIDIEISNTKLRLDLDKLTEKYKIQNLEYINDVVKINETKIYKDIKNKSIKDLSFD